MWKQNQGRGRVDALCTRFAKWRWTRSDLRSDDWAQNICLRIEGAVSDLHTTDALYHKVCMSLFRFSKNIDRSKDDTEQHNEAFTMLVIYMAEDQNNLICPLSSIKLMANIITSVVTNRPTSLQVALGVVIREKSPIELLCDFGVTSSYDEIL